MLIAVEVVVVEANSSPAAAAAPSSAQPATLTADRGGPFPAPASAAAAAALSLSHASLSSCEQRALRAAGGRVDELDDDDAGRIRPLSSSAAWDGELSARLSREEHRASPPAAGMMCLKVSEIERKSTEREQQRRCSLVPGLGSPKKRVLELEREKNFVSPLFPSHRQKERREETSLSPPHSLSTTTLRLFCFLWAATVLPVVVAGF